MSAIPVLDVQLRSPARDLRPRPIFRPAPIYTPFPQVETKTRVRTEPSVVSRAGLRVLGFAGIAAVTYLVSALAGEVTLERVRQEGFAASGQAANANKMEARLRTRLDELKSPDAIQAWADTHNFVATKG